MPRSGHNHIRISMFMAQNIYQILIKVNVELLFSKTRKYYFFCLKLHYLNFIFPASCSVKFFFKKPVKTKSGSCVSHSCFSGRINSESRLLLATEASKNDSLLLYTDLSLHIPRSVKQRGMQHFKGLCVFVF